MVGTLTDSSGSYTAAEIKAVHAHCPATCGATCGTPDDCGAHFFLTDLCFDPKRKSAVDKCDEDGACTCVKSDGGTHKCTEDAHCMKDAVCSDDGKCEVLVCGMTCGDLIQTFGTKGCTEPPAFSTTNDKCTQPCGAVVACNTNKIISSQELQYR